MPHTELLWWWLQLIKAELTNLSLLLLAFTNEKGKMIDCLGFGGPLLNCPEAACLCQIEAGTGVLQCILIMQKWQVKEDL